MSFYYRDYGLKSPVKRASDLGSTHNGTGHAIRLKYLSMALIPVMVWGLYAIITLAGMDGFNARLWLAEPINTIPALISVVVVFYHAALGGQDVFIDYVPNRTAQFICVAKYHLLCCLGCMIALYSILSIAFKG